MNQMEGYLCSMSRIPWAILSLKSGGVSSWSGNIIYCKSLKYGGNNKIAM